MIDLHTHSSASDGSFSPSSLMEEAERRLISAIALTDHDTVNGLEEAATAARKRGIRFIPGIELEIVWNGDSGGEFHLLGLGINRPSSSFKAAVQGMVARREKRNLEIMERMNEANISASYDEIRALAGGESVGRPHFAAFLVKKKLVKNIEQAFLRYLGRGKPFYIPKVGLEFESAVAVIRESGGIAVLAHPMSLYVSWGHIPALLKSLQKQGLDGIEAWHPTARFRSCCRLEELGKEMGLLISAGSDFHGVSRLDRKLGITSGNRSIGEEFLVNIEEKLGRRL